jgi:hypothetical protein
VPLHQQRFVSDLAATNPIDREVSEKRTGAKVAQRSPQLLVIGAGAFLKRSYGNQAGRVCLSGWVIAPKVWIGEAEATREIGRGRANFRSVRQLLLPLARPYDSICKSTERGRKTSDPGRDTSDDW